MRSTPLWSLKKSQIFPISSLTFKLRTKSSTIFSSKSGKFPRIIFFMISTHSAIHFLPSDIFARESPRCSKFLSLQRFTKPSKITLRFREKCTSAFTKSSSPNSFKRVLILEMNSSISITYVLSVWLSTCSKRPLNT